MLCVSARRGSVSQERNVISTVLSKAGNSDDRQNSLPFGRAFTLDFTGEPPAGELLHQTFGGSRMAMCVTDPRLADNPIVYANEAFEALTGYEAAGIVGRNCRFLQGPGTEEEAVQELRLAILERRTCIVELQNYRKDGRPFRNALHIGPIYDASGRLRYFFGSQWDVSAFEGSRDESLTAVGERHGLNRRIDNLFAVIGSIVSHSARATRDDGDAAARARARIAAVGRAHENLAEHDEEPGAASLAMLTTAILTPFRERAHVPVEAAGDPVPLQMSAITPLGLVLHELAANSVRHGSLGGHGSGLFLDWECGAASDARLRLVWRDHSVGGGRTAIAAGAGTRIIQSMVRSFDGTFTARYAAGAYEAVIEMPVGAVAAIPHGGRVEMLGGSPRYP